MNLSYRAGDTERDGFAVVVSGEFLEHKLGAPVALGPLVVVATAKAVIVRHAILRADGEEDTLADVVALLQWTRGELAAGWRPGADAGSLVDLRADLASTTPLLRGA